MLCSVVWIHNASSYESLLQLVRMELSECSGLMMLPVKASSMDFVMTTLSTAVCDFFACNHLEVLGNMQATEDKPASRGSPDGDCLL